MRAAASQAVLSKAQLVAASVTSVTSTPTNSNAVKVGTHDGSFHCDEALACYMLRLTEKYQHAEIVRTRDAKVLQSLPIIVDVGGVYDPAKGRLDHHQREFNHPLNEKYSTKLSSAGLVYKHFGHEILARLTGWSGTQLELLYDRTYKNFMEAIDGRDNGVNQYPPDIKPAYVSNTDLGARVAKLNPWWNERLSESEVMERFRQAMEMTGKEFVDSVMYLAKSWYPAREIVERAVSARTQHHKSGQIIVLPEYTVWPSHLLEVEAELKVDPPILYVLYEDSNKSWRVQCVPASEGSFVSRKPLPEPWRGVRDDTLSKLIGIDGCIFAHATGFIGGAKSFNSVLSMATLALEANTPVTLGQATVTAPATAAGTAQAHSADDRPAKKQKLCA